jgi:hypothetical protein
MDVEELRNFSKWGRRVKRNLGGVRARRPQSLIELGSRAMVGVALWGGVLGPH